MVRYTSEDIERWEATSAEVLRLLLQQLRDEPDGRVCQLGRGYLSLEGSAWSNALISAARSQWPTSLGWLRVSVDAICVLYEACMAGRRIAPQSLAAGNWQTLLHAHASTDSLLVSRFCKLFDLEFAARREIGSTKDSLFIGRLVKALTEHRLDDARALLSRQWPSVERMFRGFVECLQAVAMNYEVGFARSLQSASAAWQKYASRNWKGLPDAVCFLNGVGLVRLAEHTWQKRVTLSDPNIPAELLGDIKPDIFELAI